MVDLDDLDVTEIEREICRLPDVAVTRIVADESGRITEVHVVAQGAKHPKQIARDVQSVALASFGLELDRRIISVVQLGDEQADALSVDAPATVPSAIRPVIERVAVQTTGVRAEVHVGLRLGESTAVGHAEGSTAAATRHRLVAAATVDALRRLVPAVDAIEVDAAQILRVGALDVAVVTVVHVAPPAEHVLSGSAVVTRGLDAQAVVRAVLDATNRRLGPRA
jgi:hypothetical protein